MISVDQPLTCICLSNCFHGLSSQHIDMDPTSYPYDPPTSPLLGMSNLYLVCMDIWVEGNMREGCMLCVYLSEAVYVGWDGMVFMLLCMFGKLHLLDA